MQVSLHPAPRMRDVVVEQIRTVALSVRPIALILAAVFGGMTVLIAVDMARGKAGTWFDAGETTPIILFSFLFPFLVWRADKRFAPAFLWTLPVDRRRLAVARVFAGWVWLFTAVAMLIAWHAGLAALARVPHPETVPLMALPAATAMYLLGSAVALGLRHPLRWLCGGFAVLFLAGEMRTSGGGDGIDLFLRVTGLYSAADRALPILRALPPLAQWAITTFLWVGAGLAALLAAVARHRERRRP